MADAVEIAFHRAARELILPGARVLVAVSGGGDSVALLHLLHRFAARRRAALIVAHLDHALRRGSTADRRFVDRLAASLELPSVAARRDVRAERLRGESLEEAARRVRRAFLAESARELGAGAIATGHTLDDQAETVVMRLVRGAGPAALGAMATRGPGPYVRPLLGLERAALRAWLRRRKLPWRDDPSNEKLAFDRNRVRRLILPVLTRHLNPRAARHLVEGAARLREDADFLDTLAREQLEALARQRGGALAIDAAAFAALPRPLASRVARAALDAAGCDPRRVSSRHVTSVLALARSTPGAKVDLPGGAFATLRRGLVEFGPCASPRRS